MTPSTPQTAQVAAPSGEFRSWQELENAVNVASATIHLLSDYLATKIEDHRSDTAGLIATGIVTMGFETSKRLDDAFQAAFRSHHNQIALKS